MYLCILLLCIPQTQNVNFTMGVQGFWHLGALLRLSWASLEASWSLMKRFGSIGWRAAGRCKPKKPKIKKAYLCYIVRKNKVNANVQAKNGLGPTRNEHFKKCTQTGASWEDRENTKKRCFV